MNIFGIFYAILRRDGTLDLDSRGEPMIFANKGPHAHDNAARRDRVVGRVAVISEEHIEPRLTSLEVKAREGEPMEINAEFAGELMKRWAAGMAEWFRKEGGRNFITVEMLDPTSGERFEITMRKAHGTTPAQRLRELEAEIARLKGQS